MGYEPLDDFMRIGMHDPASAPGAHPEPEVLLAYQADELRDAEAARVRDHVAGCSTCRQCVDDFAAIPKLESEGAARSDADLNADWLDLMNRLRRGDTKLPEQAQPPQPTVIPFPLPAPDEPVRRPTAAGASTRGWLPLAASLAVAGVGLGGWQYHLARAPHGNLVIADAAPERTLRSTESGPEWARIVVPPDKERLVLLFPLAGDDLPSESTGTGASAGGASPATTYRLEIAPKEEPARTCLRRDGLVRDADGNLSLDLAPRFLAAGQYQARVFAEADADASRVTVYRFELVYP